MNANYSQMSSEDKIRATAVMYGNGSRQHLAAIQRFDREGKR